MTTADTYRRTMTGIQAVLLDLTEEAEANFGTDPEEADWGHIGSARDILTKLEDLRDRVTRSGEYA